VAFSQDGRYLAGGVGDQATIWDVQTGKRLFTLSGHTGGVHSIAFSPDSKRLLTGSDDQTVKVWDIQSGCELLTLKGHMGQVLAVAFSPDGRHVVTGGFDSTARIWDLDAVGEMRTFKPPARKFDGAFGSSGLILPEVQAISADAGRALIDYDKPTVWDIASGKELFTLQGSQRGIAGAFSPDGRLIAAGSGNLVYLWDAITGGQRFALKGHTGLIGCVGFSPDSRVLITGGWDATARLWDTHTGRELHTLRGQEQMIVSVAFSPDGKLVATGGIGSRLQNSPTQPQTTGTTRIWDVRAGKALHTLQGGTQSLAFSPDGKRIAGGNNRVVMIRDLRTGRELLSLKGHFGNILTVAFSPDGKRILSGSRDKTAILWDAWTGRELLTLQGHTDSVRSVLFSSDGRRIVTGSLDGTVKEWFSE
jgi:WD40 repeat protein